MRFLASLGMTDSDDEIAQQAFSMSFYFQSTLTVLPTILEKSLEI